MKHNKNGVRGNNTVSKSLNKKIDGKLAKKQSSGLVILVFSILFLVIWGFCVNELGFKTGSLTAIGFSVLLAIANTLSNNKLEQAEKMIKKHPWKSFDDNE